MTAKLNMYFLACFLLLSTVSYAQDRTILGKSHAKKELMSALSGVTGHNVIDNKTVIIKDSLIAISISEPILFSIYGEGNIIKQRPYEIYLIDNHWIVSGTLPKRYLGGTFLIILNALDSRILRITHGK
jgi:hypothetical protein